MATDAHHDPSNRTRLPETATFAPDLSPRNPPEALPESIGKYSIKRLIAAGGMGIVYEARQENPRRAVALKVMNHGVASRSALRRFEFEAQVLGRLKHPGIAQIYEAGTHVLHGVAVPFFAMEYIPNAQTITQFAAERRLDTRERLKLFAQVCDAVHHGHQKGVIHRDLKPSNILVDSAGQVKVIDFGVARGTDSDLALTTQQTDMGQLIGTLQYMSPEQCQADPNDIDTRSDVYALGVIFFELLTERLPYDIREVAVHEATRVIREEQPTRLSTIKKTLRGDIETIVSKALEKDRTRRYQSALEFAQDIQRHLENEPIIARPPSMAYRLTKFVRRRRVPLAAAAVVTVTLIAGLNQQVRLSWSKSLISSLATANRVALAAQPDADFSNPVPIIGDCNDAIAVDANFALGYAIRAKAYTRKEELEPALRDATRALELDPENTYAHRALGHVFLMKGEFDRAKEAYMKGFRQFADKKNPDLPRDLHNMARACAITGDFQMALVCHDAAVALAPNTGFVYLSRGLTRRMSGDLEGAIADISHGSSLMKDTWGVRGGLWTWEILSLRNSPGDAEAATQALIDAEPLADSFEKAVLDVLRDQTPVERMFRIAKSEIEQSCALYYLGVKVLIHGQIEEARSRFEGSAKFGLHQLPEYDLARWHLARLGQQN